MPENNKNKSKRIIIIYRHGSIIIIMVTGQDADLLYAEWTECWQNNYYGDILQAAMIMCRHDKVPQTVCRHDSVPIDCMPTWQCADRLCWHDSVPTDYDDMTVCRQSMLTWQCADRLYADMTLCRQTMLTWQRADRLYADMTMCQQTLCRHDKAPTGLYADMIRCRQDVCCNDNEPTGCLPTCQSDDRLCRHDKVLRQRIPLSLPPPPQLLLQTRFRTSLLKLL